MGLSPRKPGRNSLIRVTHLSTRWGALQSDDKNSRVAVGVPPLPLMKEGRSLEGGMGDFPAHAVDAAQHAGNGRLQSSVAWPAKSAPRFDSAPPEALSGQPYKPVKHRGQTVQN